jgi:general secretion pathway protein G
MKNVQVFRSRKSGFTLVEILIVVIILGILAAIVIPQFTNASTNARVASTVSQLQSLRSQIQLYKLQHNDTLPDLVANQWSQFMSKTDVTGSTTATTGLNFGPYLESTPSNPLNGFSAVAAAPAASTGWVYDKTTGDIKATNQTPTGLFDESTQLVN